MKFTHISKKQVFKNDVITVFEEKLELPNNNIVTWTFTGKKEVVAIIAEIEGEIIFVKQYRPAIKKELLEIPAGLVEKGEDILEAAKREFEEEIGYYALHKEDGPKFNPFFIPKMIADIASGHISIRFGFHGPNFTTTSACASSTNAISQAFNLIRLGKADMIVSGGAEAAITEAGVGGFTAMPTLSTHPFFAS